MTKIVAFLSKSPKQLFIEYKYVYPSNKRRTELLAPIVTTSFCEDEGRAKDRVESGTGFVRSENLLALNNQKNKFNTQQR